MSVVEDVATLLASDLSLTAGRRLFGHVMPETSDNPDVSSTGPLLAILETVGLPPIGRFTGTTGGLPAFERPSFVVVARSTDGSAGHPTPVPARSLIQRAWASLESHPANGTLNGRRYTFETFGSPYLQNRDGRGRYEFVFQCFAHSEPASS